MSRIRWWATGTAALLALAVGCTQAPARRGGTPPGPGTAATDRPVAETKDASADPAATIASALPGTEVVIVGHTALVGWSPATGAAGGTTARTGTAPAGTTGAAGTTTAPTGNGPGGTTGTTTGTTGITGGTTGGTTGTTGATGTTGGATGATAGGATGTTTGTTGATVAPTGTAAGTARPDNQRIASAVRDAAPYLTEVRIATDADTSSRLAAVAGQVRAGRSAVNYLPQLATLITGMTPVALTMGLGTTPGTTGTPATGTTGTTPIGTP